MANMKAEHIQKIVYYTQNFPGVIVSPSSVGISTNKKLYCFDGFSGKRRFGNDEQIWKLWHELTALLIHYHIDSWKAEYDNPDVSDGYGWTLLVALQDGTIRQHVGINAKPVGLTKIETAFRTLVTTIANPPIK